MFTKKRKDMKTISVVKLNQLCKSELKERQMNALLGGSACVCIGCLCQWDPCGCIADCTHDCNDVTDSNLNG